MSPSRTALIAGAASGFMRTHHCFITSGSSTVPQRSCTPTECVIGSSFSRRPFPRSSSTIWRRAVSRSGPASGPAAGVIIPRLSMTESTCSPWRCPISKSVASWPGVILSAPVPNSRSTASSAMIRTRRSTAGRLDAPPHLREELLAAQLLAGDPLLRELVLHDDLGDDPGMVGPGHPEGRLALHAVPARHEVLVSAETERVPEMEVAGHVREGQHHHKRLIRIALVGREESGALPPGIEVRLDGGRPEVLLREAQRGLGWCAHRRRHRRYLQTKTPPRPRTSGVVVPPWLRTAQPRRASSIRANGRTRSGSRATFRTFDRGTLAPVARLLYRCEARTPPGRCRMPSLYGWAACGALTRRPHAPP